MNVFSQAVEDMTQKVIYVLEDYNSGLITLQECYEQIKHINSMMEGIAYVQKLANKK